MNEEETKKLCLELIRSESEAGAIQLLERAHLWQSSDAWQWYGGNENNFSTIGNQQSSPDTALVEKLINSVDAVLMREVLRAGIEPESSRAPHSIQDALEKFFGLYRGRLSSIDANKRSEIAENILLVATGDKKHPSYAVIDKGEGQSPARIPHTFLSLNKSNKLKIPFVQGKFNMGSTGALQFCSPKHNLQLLVSKRDPLLPGNHDATAKYWGFTIVRREDPTGNLRSSSFRYLAPGKEILRFESPAIPALPGEYPNAYQENLEHGTYIKLYDYQIGPSLRTLIGFDLYNRLSLLMPSLALPITLYERRDGYRAHTYQSVMSGLNVRLEEDKRDNIEENFPNSAEITIEGQKMEIQIYAFKKGQREKYAKNEGVIFSVNGQAHGFFPKQFFERKGVGMQSLSDSILVLVDCSQFQGRAREDLFMNSRDRLREGPLKEEIEDQLMELLRTHPGLRELREKRKREEIEDRLQDSKPLAEILENLIRKSPTLSRMFIKGLNIQNPFNLVDGGTGEKFHGRKYPTYFKLSKEYSKDRPKGCPRNHKFRVQFNTDAVNIYFQRDVDPGEFRLFFEGNELKDYSLNLWNGIATLTVTLPAKTLVGDILVFESEVSDGSRVEPFKESFHIQILQEETDDDGGGGTRKKPTDEKKKGSGKIPSSLSIPHITEIRKGDSEYKDEKQALLVKDYGDGEYRFYINMDNVYLKHELKTALKDDPKLLEARFKFALVLLGIGLLEYHNKNESERNDQTESIYDRIASVTTAISPMVLPMIASLGDLTLVD